MENKNNTNLNTQNLFSNNIVPNILLLNGITILIFGFIFFFISGIGDPGDFNPETKRIMVKQGNIVGIGSIIYFITCLVSRNLWIKGYVYGNYIIIVLGLISLSVSVFITFNFEESNLSVLLTSLLIMMNIFLIVVVLKKIIETK
jgi:hypothetical protein